MRLALGLALAGASLLHAAPASAPAAAASPAPAAPEPTLTPAELARSRELEALAKAGRELLDKLNKAESAPEYALPQGEKERQVRAIIERYERLLRDNPDHLETLLLYGKFLRLVGERDLAYSAFQRADKLNGELAVVKHQLGAHLAENGDFPGAFPLLLRATQLAPDEPRYRYDFAEFLATAADSDTFDDKPTRAERDRLMLENFDRAAALRPAEAGYRWRAAEARYDARKPDPAEALARWEALDKEAGTPAEKEVVSLHRARWLIVLNRTAEARKLIGTSTSPALKATRARLRDELLKKEPGLTDPFPGRDR